MGSSADPTNLTPIKLMTVNAYGVDAGTGCFVDYDAAELIANLVSFEVRYPEKDEFEMFCDRAIAEMEKNSFGKHRLTASWANMKVSHDSEANIVAFSSGWETGVMLHFGDMVHQAI